MPTGPGPARWPLPPSGWATTTSPPAWPPARSCPPSARVGRASSPTSWSWTPRSGRTSARRRISACRADSPPRLTCARCWASNGCSEATPGAARSRSGPASSPRSGAPSARSRTPRHAPALMPTAPSESSPSPHCLSARPSGRSPTASWSTPPASSRKWMPGRLTAARWAAPTPRTTRTSSAASTRSPGSRSTPGATPAPRKTWCAPTPPPTRPSMQRIPGRWWWAPPAPASATTTWSGTSVS